MDDGDPPSPDELFKTLHFIVEKNGDKLVKTVGHLEFLTMQVHGAVMKVQDEVNKIHRSVHPLTLTSMLNTRNRPWSLLFSFLLGEVAMNLVSSSGLPVALELVLAVAVTILFMLFAFSRLNE